MKKESAAVADQLELVPTPAVESRYPIEELVAAIEQVAQKAPHHKAHLEVVGATGALGACALSDLSRRVGRPVLVLTATPQEAHALAGDLSVFALGEEEDLLDSQGAFKIEGTSNLLDRVVHYPEFDIGPFHSASPERKLMMQRLGALHLLSGEERPRYTVAPLSAAIRRTIPRQTLRQFTRRFELGDEVSNEVLRVYLATCGYTEVPVVEDPGTFAIRGDIIDIFVPTRDHPLRVERWGDEISEIRSFNAETQRTVQEHLDCEIFPVRQEILDDELVRQARGRLRQLGETLQYPSRGVREVAADLEAGLHFIGIDALLPALHAEFNDLFDYISPDTLVVLWEPDAMQAEAGQMLENRRAEYALAREKGELIFEVDSYYRGLDELARWVEARDVRLDFRRVAIRDLEATQALSPAQSLEFRSFEFRARPNTDISRLQKEHRSAERTVEALVGLIQQWRGLYGRICVACRTSGQVDRLVSLLKNYGEDAIDLEPPIDVVEPVPPPAELIEVYQATISSGFRSEHLGLCLISGEEIFGRRVATHSTKSITEHAEITHFRDLNPGDHVVHVDFGVGKYHGLINLEVSGISADFLHLEYAGGDKLYIPVHRLEKVQKYIGRAAEEVRLDKMGGSSWERTKERVKEQIREIAGELLRLYAQRELARGYRFSAPDDYYREFEADFPFEETPDQARAIHDTLSDMCSKRPMDRLICGDVGFGKTEVAIRAAMKAVMDGKQVAVLAPTTILAEQHRVSFRARCEKFGARVESLSRFRTTKESREIVADAAAGKVDILIGTHRILSRDIQFRDLGLLIVDEEQRFGVTHKDRIKQLRNNIDVLTLSATPIPRTLQMSLLGIRDLSIIATPPHNRLAVRTHLAKSSDGILREAIMREITRGGQVFLVHNRVKSINEVAEHVGKLVPEARISVGHGQMSEKDLEEVMLSYIDGETNVMVCSAIIESGLDIPNANTIIINRADLFGLSQLYQLRGRVGRGSERAYAYLLVPPTRVLPKDAQARLEVIQTHTELGSGFQVATYDLEIRGAGNLLGDDQSGHVQAVGLDLYTELLEETVNDMRGLDPSEDIEPEVNLPVEAFIPASYIEAVSLRLMFYKRFSLARTHDELFEVFEELIDRFGKAPEPVTNLRDVIAIKVACRQLMAPRFDCGPSAISMELDERTALRPEKVIELVHQTRGRLRITEDMKLVYSLTPEESAHPLGTSRQFVERLLTYRAS